MSNCIVKFYVKAKAIQLTTSDKTYPIWESPSFALPRNLEIQYKYGLTSGGQFTSWERLEGDRRITLSQDKMHVHDTFGVVKETTASSEKTVEPHRAQRVLDEDKYNEECLQKVQNGLGKNKMIIVSRTLPVTLDKRPDGTWKVAWDTDNFIGRSDRSIADYVRTIWVGGISRYNFDRALPDPTVDLGKPKSTHQHTAWNQPPPAEGDEAEGDEAFDDSATSATDLYDEFSELMHGRMKADPVDQLTNEDRENIAAALEPLSCYPVFMPNAKVRSGFDAYCHAILWPALHNVLDPMTRRLTSGREECLDDADWEMYTVANQCFAERTASFYSTGDIFWIHDYELCALPQQLAEIVSPRPSMVFFLHAPFPTSEIFRTLSAREHLLNGILSADVIGFHTFNHARHFLQCSKRLLGLNFQSRKGGRMGVEIHGRDVMVAISHVGVDTSMLDKCMKSEAAAVVATMFRVRHPQKIIIAGFDVCQRLSGVALKLLAFEKLLMENLIVHRDVVLVQRCEVPLTRPLDTQKTSQEIHALVRRINDRFGFVVDYEEAAHYSLSYRTGLFHCTSVLFQTSIREGLNLLPLEYVYCCTYWQLQRSKAAQRTASVLSAGGGGSGGAANTSDSQVDTNEDTPSLFGASSEVAGMGVSPLYGGHAGSLVPSLVDGFLLSPPGGGNSSALRRGLSMSKSYSGFGPGELYASVTGGRGPGGQGFNEAGRLPGVWLRMAGTIVTQDVVDETEGGEADLTQDMGGDVRFSTDSHGYGSGAFAEARANGLAESSARNSHRFDDEGGIPSLDSNATSTTVQGTATTTASGVEGFPSTDSYPSSATPGPTQMQSLSTGSDFDAQSIGSHDRAAFDIARSISRTRLPVPNAEPITVLLPPPQMPGCVVLSEFSAASHVLNSNITINPYNVTEACNDLSKALLMEDWDRALRQWRDYQNIMKNPTVQWTSQVILDVLPSSQDDGGSLEFTEVEPSVALHSTRRFIVGNQGNDGELNELDIERAVQRFKAAKKRVLFFDYGGTLISREGIGQYVKQEFLGSASTNREMPDKVMQALVRLAAATDTLVFVLTGMRASSLDNMTLGELPYLCVAAENGGEVSWGLKPLQLPLQAVNDTTNGTSAVLKAASIPTETLQADQARWMSQLKQSQALHAAGAEADSTQAEAEPARRWTAAEIEDPDERRLWGMVSETAKTIMESYAWRVNGSSVKVYNSHVIWDYRHADPEWGASQAKFLTKDLMEAIRSSSARINMVDRKARVEVSYALRTKASVVSDVLKLVGDVDFVLSIGDDSSDEEVFMLLQALLGSHTERMRTADSSEHCPGEAECSDDHTTSSHSQRHSAAGPVVEGSGFLDTPLMTGVRPVVMPPETSLGISAAVTDTQSADFRVGVQMPEGGPPPMLQSPRIRALTGGNTVSKEFPLSPSSNSVGSSGLHAELLSRGELAVNLTEASEPGKRVQVPPSTDLDKHSIRDVFTVTVGRKRSNARFFVHNVSGVYKLIRRLAAAVTPDPSSVPQSPFGEAAPVSPATQTSITNGLTMTSLPAEFKTQSNVHSASMSSMPMHQPNWAGVQTSAATIAAMGSHQAPFSAAHSLATPMTLPPHVQSAPNLVMSGSTPQQMPAQMVSSSLSPGMTQVYTGFTPAAGTGLDLSASHRMGAVMMSTGDVASMAGQPAGQPPMYASYTATTPPLAASSIQGQQYVRQLPNGLLQLMPSGIVVQPQTATAAPVPFAPVAPGAPFPQVYQQPPHTGVPATTFTQAPTPGLGLTGSAPAVAYAAPPGMLGAIAPTYTMSGAATVPINLSTSGGAIQTIHLPPGTVLVQHGPGQPHTLAMVQPSAVQSVPPSAVGLASDASTQSLTSASALPSLSTPAASIAQTANQFVHLSAPGDPPTLTIDATSVGAITEPVTAAAATTPSLTPTASRQQPPAHISPAVLGDPAMSPP